MAMPAQFETFWKHWGMLMIYRGGCRCGRVSYQIEAAPKFQLHCQCVECQKLTGAGHAAIIVFPKEAFNSKGTVKTFGYRAESGHDVIHHFCGECGAPLYNLNSHYTNAVYIMVGSLEDPSLFTPERIVFASSGQEWDIMDPELPGFQGMPKR